MRRLLKGCLVILMIAVPIYVLLVAGRGWAGWQSRWELEREYLYGRALEWAVAERAGPATPSAFEHVLPFTTPVADRPPGADPAAFIGTAPAVLSCRRTPAQMRAEGPGECSAIYPAVNEQQPSLCEFVPCTVVVVRSELWDDPQTRPAFTTRALHRRMCSLRESMPPMGWTRDARDLPDCRPGGFTPGLLFVVIRRNARDDLHVLH